MESVNTVNNYKKENTLINEKNRAPSSDVSRNKVWPQPLSEVVVLITAWHSLFGNQRIIHLNN